MDLATPSLRHAVRSLRRDSGLSLLAILCLALGIGTCVTLFTSVNPWLFRPLPYAAPDRLTGLRQTLPEGGGEWSGRSLLSGPDFLDWQARARSFESMGAFERVEHNLSTEGEPERVAAVRVTATLLPTLGIAPVLGRGFRPDEDRRGSHVAVIGHGLWQRRLGADPGVVGRTLRLDGELHTILGVMPERFAFPEYAEVWTPLGLEVGGDRGDRRLDVLARLRPRTTVAQAQAELEAVAAALAREHPDTNEGRSALVWPYLKGLVPPGVVSGLYLVLGAAFFVLLIANANVASLLLVKAAGRRREIAVRLALGARRVHVVRQSLAETALLVGAGGALGLLLGSLGAAGLEGSTAVPPPFWARFALDVRVVAFTVAVMAFSALVVGLVPALRAGRESVVEDLKEGGRVGGGGGARARLGRLLAVSELAAALVLLIGAALMVQSFERRYRSDSLRDGHAVLTARLALAGEAYREPDRRAAFVEELLRRLAASAEVAAAGAGNALPFRDPLSGGWWATTFEVDGQPVEARRAPRAACFTVTRAYTDAAGIAVVAGRTFQPEEEAEGREVVLVNEALARRFGGGASALGRRLRVAGGPWLRVVGVTRDVSDAGDMLLADTKPSEQVYVPYRIGAPADVALAVRTRSDPLRFVESLRAAVRSLDPALPLHSVYTLDEVRLRSAWVARLWGQMLSQVAVLALILALLGVYGVVAYSVSQRAHEIGIRVAVGATRGEILRLVLGDALRLAAQAVAVGLLGAVFLTRSLTRLLYGVGALDPATLAGCALALVLAALAASGGPAWRGTRVDPVVALRAE